MDTFVALLRGINVGGKNALPMDELKSVLSARGLEDVATYIRSGNVVFRSRTGDGHAVAAGIEKQITETFSVTVAVLMRTPAELAEIAESNPFLGGKPDHSRLHVVFLASAPTAKATAQLDPERSPPDEFSSGDARSTCTCRTVQRARS
jgi:uncharacterized protein (DUF1697 family)